jgi:hypothetical protein
MVLRLDPARIEQILNNLVSNAIKYSPAGGEVIVRVERQTEHVILSGSDRGLGISPEEQPRLFEPFRRAGSSAPVFRKPAQALLDPRRDRGWTRLSRRFSRRDRRRSTAVRASEQPSPARSAPARHPIIPVPERVHPVHPLGVLPSSARSTEPRPPHTAIPDLVHAAPTPAAPSLPPGHSHPDPDHPSPPPGRSVPTPIHLSPRRGFPCPRSGPGPDPTPSTVSRPRSRPPGARDT